MTGAAQTMRPPELDEPIRRLVFVIPAAIALWAILLGIFSTVLTRTAAPPAELKPLEARLIEIPPDVGGLAPAAAPHPAAPTVAKPKLPAVRPHPLTHPKTILAPVVRSPLGTSKTTEAPTLEAPTAPSAPPAAGETSADNEGSGAAIGSDTVGAHAIYNPTPEIPDDLREDVIEAEAVARFTVSYDGTAEVTLEKPTSNPRLNQVLLDALKKWKFSPAIKDGVAINSSFELRIPISVR